MKLNIFFVLFTVQAEYFDEELTTHSLNAQTSFIPSFTFLKESSDQTTLIRSSTFENNEQIQDQWFNSNEKSVLLWKKVSSDLLDDSFTYLLKSEKRNECVRQMCSVHLQFNGTLKKNREACLTFILWTRGQPVGQLWIEEDQEESYSQKIQLTNSTLRVQHSLKANRKKLALQGRILFPNPSIDAITLSNLHIQWNGPCSTNNFEEMNDQSSSTIEMNSLSTDQTSSSSEIIEQSTKPTLNTLKTKFSFLHQKNVLWFIYLIILICFLIILSSLIYGLWSIQRHFRQIWYIPSDYPIQYISRRSIRSSTRSKNDIGTLSQICFDLRQMNFLEESFETFSTTSIRSTSSEVSICF